MNDLAKNTQQVKNESHVLLLSAGSIEPVSHCPAAGKSERKTEKCSAAWKKSDVRKKCLPGRFPEQFSALLTLVLGSKIAHGILDFIPWLWPAKSAVAYGVTKMVGEAVIHYFHDCSPLPEGG